jgi:hypothetical protein
MLKKPRRRYKARKLRKALNYSILAIKNHIILRIDRGQMNQDTDSFDIYK